MQTECVAWHTCANLYKVNCAISAVCTESQDEHVVRLAAKLSRQPEGRISLAPLVFLPAFNDKVWRVCPLANPVLPANTLLCVTNRSNQTACDILNSAFGTHSLHKEENRGIF